MRLNPRFNLPFLAYHVLPDTGGAYHDQTMSSCDTNNIYTRGPKDPPVSGIILTIRLIKNSVKILATIPYYNLLESYHYMTSLLSRYYYYYKETIAYNLLGASSINATNISLLFLVLFLKYWAESASSKVMCELAPIFRLCV